MWFFLGILIDVCTIILFMVVIGINKKKLLDKPIDDSKWNIDKVSLYNSLQKFVSNKQETIYAVLNVQNALNLLKNGISEEGFAILTDKACYFVGKVYQKKGIFTFKSNIQHRIVASEMKGVKVGSLSRLGMVIPAVISVMLSVSKVKWFIKGFLFESVYVNTNEELYNILLLVGFGVAFILLYLIISCFTQVFIVRRTNMCIEFSTLTVAFLISSLGAKEIKDFYKAVSNVQAMYMNSIAVVNAVNNINSENKVQQLSEISRLYEQGMIDEEEFNKLKAEIINKV